MSVAGNFTSGDFFSGIAQMFLNLVVPLVPIVVVFGILAKFIGVFDRFGGSDYDSEPLVWSSPKVACGYCHVDDFLGYDHQFSWHGDDGLCYWCGAKL